MASSKKKENTLDYSDCKFESLVRRPLPQGVKHMIERALKAFGPDHHVLATQWTEPLPGGKTEATWFSNSPPIDICCADAASWAISQTGVTDLRTNKYAWDGYWQYADGHEEKGFLHGAPFWGPEPRNVEHLTLLSKTTKASDLVDGNGEPAREGLFLPGDYFLYSQHQVVRGRAPDVPSHINVYLGPFQEVVDGDHVGPVFSIYNGSLGTGGRSAWVRPVELSEFNYFANHGWTIWHCRVNAIARLYQMMVGLPIASAADDPRGASERIAEVWTSADGAAAPYPVGRALTWHDGIHIHDTRPAAAFAPGRVTRVRMSPTTELGDSSFVLIQHRFDPSQRVMAMPRRESDTRKQDGEDDEIPLYGATLHLAPPETYIDGIAEGAPKPKPDAPPWIRRLFPKLVPEPRTFIPQDATLHVLTWGEGGDLVAFATSPGPLNSEMTDPEGRGVPRHEASGRPFYDFTQHLKVSNAGAWSTAPHAPSVPLNHKLTYWNAHAGLPIETPFVVPEATRMRVADDRIVVVAELEGGDVLARIDHYDEPAIPVHHEDLAPAPDDAELVACELIFKDGCKLEMYLEHTDVAGQRDVKAPIAKVVVGPALAKVLHMQNGRVLCKNIKNAEAAFLDVVPCLRLTPSERETLDSRLAERAASAEGKALVRLQSGETCVLAAVISKASGWSIDGGILHPRNDKCAEKPPKNRLELHPQVTGTGNARAIAQSQSSDIAESDVAPAYQVPATPAVRIRALEVFTNVNGTKIALIEAMLGAEVSTLTNNAKLIADMKADNVTRAKVVDRLLSGDVIDLAQEGAHADDLIVQALEQIGKTGRIPGTSPGRPGVHVQYFSGKNIVDPTVEGSSGSIEQVGKASWWVMRDDASSGLLTPDFATKLTKVLREAPFATAADLPDDALSTGVPKPSEWVAYSAGLAREHSMVISAHPAEWQQDRAAVLDDEAARGVGVTDAQRTEAKASDAEYQWLPEGTKLEGIDGAPVYFFHPMRLITWLATGLAVTISGASDPKSVGARVVTDVDTKLTYDPDTRSFPFRAVVEPEVEYIGGKLILEGVKTATKELKVKIVSGEVRPAQAVVPSLKMTTTNDTTPTSYMVPVTFAPLIPVHHVLADGDEKMKGTMPSRASFRVDLAFNKLVPTKLTVSLEGAGFSIVETELIGAVDGTGSKARTGSFQKLDFKLQPAKPPPDVFERSQSASLHVHVVAGTTFGASAKLKAEASGGDFDGSLTADMPIETREIRVDADTKKCKGEDVGKVQLYLSQILDEEKRPCFREGAKGEEYTGTGAVVLTCVYGSTLAAAIWRALYMYVGHMNAWGRFTTARETIRVTDAKGANEKTILLSSLTEMARPPALDHPNKTERRTAPKEFPVIDDVLLYIIMSLVTTEHVVPHVNCDVVERPLPPVVSTFAHGAPTTGWNTPGGRSAILPLESESVGVIVSCKELDTVEGTLDLVAELPATSAFRFDDRGTKKATLPIALLRGQPGRLKLVFSGTLTGKQEDNLLLLRSKSSGMICGALQLTGTRELAKKQGGAFRDAALAQLFLSQALDSSGKKACLLGSRGAAPKIDGAWGDGSAAALSNYLKAAKAPSASAAMWAELEKKVIRDYEEEERRSRGMDSGG